MVTQPRLHRGYDGRQKIPCRGNCKHRGVSFAEKYREFPTGVKNLSSADAEERWDRQQMEREMEQV